MVAVGNNVSTYTRMRPSNSLISSSELVLTGVILLSRLFAFPTPRTVPQDYIPGTKLDVPDSISERNAIKKRRVQAPGKTAREVFLRHAIDVLTCNHSYKNFQSGADRETRWFRFSRSLSAVAMWTSYFLQVIFPLFSIAAVLVVYTDWYCTLHLGECIFAESYGIAHNGDL